MNASDNSQFNRLSRCNLFLQRCKLISDRTVFEVCFHWIVSIVLALETYSCLSMDFAITHLDRLQILRKL